MQREEFLQMLKDPLVCQEIYKIVQNGGHPLEAAPKATDSKPDGMSHADAERIAALRERWRQNLVHRNSSSAESAEQKATSDVPETDAPETVPEEKANTERIQTLAQKLAVLRGSVEDKKKAEQDEADFHANKESHDDEYTFVIERKCPVCEQTTRIVKCKTRMIAESKDLDFCIHYKDFNPYLYSVVACEHCGFAAEERRFLGHMPNRTREMLRAYLEENDLRVNFVQQRTVDEALQYCQLAILFTELADISPNRRAGLYLTMAWIYRYNGDKENDLACVQKAADLYDESLKSERYPVSGMTDNTAMYLAGVLYYMVKNYEKCTTYLSRIIGSQTFRAEDPKTYAKARDLWQEIKAERKALNKQ